MEILAAIVKAVGSIFSFILNYCGKRRDRRTLAAAEFRKTVLTKLEGLYPMPTDCRNYNEINYKLRQVFPILQAAVALYRPYVADKTAFDEAWVCNEA